jgi:hypothetical protein
MGRTGVRRGGGGGCVSTEVEIGRVRGGRELSARFKRLNKSTLFKKKKKKNVQKCIL